MFENYSYKKKFTVLIAVFFMLSITAYKRSFHALFQVINEYRALSEKVDDINKKIHTANDTLQNAGGDAKHAAKFAKLATAFVVELAK